MTNRIYMTLLAAAACLPMAAAPNSIRANITGGRGDQGKCTIEVVVDRTVEVEVSGDMGHIRTISGAPGRWVRLQCTAPMPRHPEDFQFRGIDGRGRVELIRDPRSNHGAAVVRIVDTKGGREGYTFDLEWRGSDDRGPRRDDRGGRR